MNRILVLLFIVVAFTAVTSCSEDYELNSYSCNKSINNWVKDHLSDIRNMSREEWISLEDSLKISVYRAFTQQQRLSFWKDKFNNIKSLDWSKEELLHIEKAESFLEDHYEFLSNEMLSDNQLDELELFGYKWVHDGERLFGWPLSLGIQMIGSGEDIHNKTDTIVYRKPVPPLNCHCHLGNSIFHTCGLSNGCYGSNCIESGSSVGCGVFLSETCDGICDF